MTDHDIRNYIESCEEPIILKDVVSELTSKDPTLSWKRITRLMREMGFENKVCKNALNEKGKGSVWTRVNAATTDGDEEVYDADITDGTDETDEQEEQEEQEERSTEDVVSDVEARNAANVEMNRRLLETLNVSRGLRAEMIARQQEVLIEMARRILGLYGSEKERKVYGGF